MSNQSRNRNLIFIIAVLLLTNIGVLAYFLWFKDSGREHANGEGQRRTGMVDILETEVGFNKEQIEQYKQLKEQQRTASKPMYDEMRKAKDNLFKLMGDSTASDTSIQRAAEVIGLRQRELDLQTFAHFKRVRALCTSNEQAVKYDSAVLRMFRRMGKPPAKKEGDQQKEIKK
jgi:periplasmic protein CpxP/Spy